MRILLEMARFPAKRLVDHVPFDFDPAASRVVVDYVSDSVSSVLSVPSCLSLLTADR
jgi:hypothetical protein